MKKHILLISLLIFNFFSSQYTDNLLYGIKAGGIYSKISGLDDMIIPKDLYTGYDAKIKPHYGVMFGVFANYRFPRSKLAIQPELLYSMQGAKFEYSDIKTRKYKIDYNYNYLRVDFLGKYYPFDEYSLFNGLNIGTGFSLGFNLNSKKIKYRYINKLDGDTEENKVELILKDKLKGISDFSLLFNLGYEWENGLMLEARYGLGLKDVIETQTNELRYAENDNKSTIIMLSLGYTFNFDKRRTF